MHKTALEKCPDTLLHNVSDVLFFFLTFVDLICVSFRCKAKIYIYTYTYTYIFFFRLFSIKDYYKILNVIS